METKNWKLSYGLPNQLFLRIEMGPTIFENWVMETENWVMRIANPNSPLVTSLDKIEISIILVFVKSKLPILEVDTLLITLL